MNQRSGPGGGTSRVAACRLVGFPIATALAAVCLGACTSSPDAPAVLPTPAVRIHSSDAPVPGAEAVSSPAVDTCPVAGRAVVEQRFGGRATAEHVGVGALGQRTCTFALGSSNVGNPGQVTLTSSVSSSSASATAAYVRARRAAASARTVTGVGDRAFYVAAEGRLQLVVGRTTVVLQATLRAPAGRTARPAVLRADLVGLGRAVAASR